MKILHLSTFQKQGGAAIAAVRLHEALLKSNVESGMLVQKRNAPAKEIVSLDDTFFHRKCYWWYFIAERLHFLPYEQNKAIRYSFSPARAGVDISNHPLIQEADIIQLHWINFGFLSLRSIEKLLALGKPVVWTMHDMWPFTGGCHYSRGCERFTTTCQYCPYLSKPAEYDLSFEIFQRKAKIYLHKDITLVSPSRWLKDLASAATLSKQLRSVVIPNPINTQVFTPQNKTEIRKKLGLPEDKKLLLFVGANTMDPRKGFPSFREAVNRIAKANAGFEIVIFGKSDMEIISTLLPKVHNLGLLSDPVSISQAYTACDLLVAPSLEDNLPNTIMEAMACGTPVVGFNTGGIPEMIDHKETGYVADYLSVESLAEGIKWVLDNPENLAENARNKVLNEYAEKVVADQYIKLYESLLTQKMIQ